MGWWDSIKDAVSDAADGVGDVVEDVAEVAGDAAASAGRGVADVISTTATAVDTATGGLAGRGLSFLDDTVFDSVDYVTGGAVNIDFDDGKFGVGLGIDDTFGLGVSVGEDGIGASLDTGLASSDVSFGRDGLTAGATAGIDFGPLPYLDGHVVVAPNGDISVNGEVQGTVPTPWGILSGEAQGGFVRTDQGWGTFLDADGTLRLPSGTSIGGLGTDATSDLLGKVAGSGGLDALLDGLDRDAAVGLVQKLVGGARPGVPATDPAAASGMDADAASGAGVDPTAGPNQGLPGGSTSGSAATAGASADLGFDDDVLGMTGGQGGGGTDVMTKAMPAAATSAMAVSDEAGASSATFDAGVSDTATNVDDGAAASAFTQQIDAADRFEASVDDMFEGLD